MKSEIDKAIWNERRQAYKMLKSLFMIALYAGETMCKNKIQEKLKHMKEFAKKSKIKL